MRRRLGGRAGIVALTAFLVLDALLVAAALNSTGGAVAGGGSVVGTPELGGAPATTTSAPASGRSSGAPTTTSPTTSSTTTAAPVLTVAPLTVGVVGVGPSAALRYTTGTCRSGSTLALTRDGGSSWATRSRPFDSILRIRVRSDGSAIALGVDAGPGCSVALSRSSAYDGSWGGAASASASWYRDPQDASKIMMPSARTGAPCGSAPVVDLAVTDAGAAVLCTDGTLRTSRTGTTWSTAVTVPGAVALALSTSGRSYLAVPGAGGCDGIAVVGSTAPATAIGCAKADLSGVAPGTVALSVTPDSGWLLVGDAAYRSSSTLRTWKRT
jgi:hypothetical protein